ncbi:MAG: DeoR/GlpR transcriptional regulator [Pedobacter sp.]|nr:MAG: DeoR/GlpR transcriptional regulator [Pedobacter sp.]
MIKEERFEHILTQLKQLGKVGYDELATQLDVSADTIRRDIDLLSNNGLLLKVRGGAMKKGKSPVHFQDRVSHLTEAKETIALKVLPLIKNGQTFFMDGGTTICAVANHLPLNASFRVITNNIALVNALSPFKEIELIVLGGIYDPVTATTTGTATCEEVKRYFADAYFMGTCAIHPNHGVTAAFMEDAAVKQAMLKCAAKTVALGDYQKLNTSYNFKVCALEDLNVLVTDIQGDDPGLDNYRNRNVKLV